MAFNDRFAMVLVGSSGKGGATLLRRNYGEGVENLSTGEYYWMDGNFIKYDASEASFGAMNPGQLPVDSNELIALCAPRLHIHQLRSSPRKAMRTGSIHEGMFHGFTIDANPRVCAARRQDS